jgi:hypothetical protein
VIHVRAIGLVCLLAVFVAFVTACGGGDGGGSEVDLTDYPYPVQHPDVIDDRAHFPLGQTYDSYTSDPPTSGPHANVPANWGISDLAVPPEQALHNMEHAGVVVWYNCNAGGPLSTEACAQLRNDLGGVVSQEIGSGRAVLMTPYPPMASRIALTAWGYLDSFDEFDAERVRLFIETFECNFDPEGFC